MADFAETEVNDLDVWVFIFGDVQKVLWLQITVSDVLFMAVIDGLQDLFENLCSVFLIEELLFNNFIKKFTTLAHFSDEVYIFIVFKVLVELNDMWVVYLL